MAIPFQWPAQDGSQGGKDPFRQPAREIESRGGREIGKNCLCLSKSESRGGWKRGKKPCPQPFPSETKSPQSSGTILPVGDHGKAPYYNMLRRMERIGYKGGGEKKKMGGGKVRREAWTGSRRGKEPASANKTQCKGFPTTGVQFSLEVTSTKHYSPRVFKQLSCLMVSSFPIAFVLERLL